jgi:hypothetical protein
MTSARSETKAGGCGERTCVRAAALQDKEVSSICRVER